MHSNIKQVRKRFAQNRTYDDPILALDLSQNILPSGPAKSSPGFSLSVDVVGRVVNRFWEQLSRTFDGCDLLDR